MTDAQHPAHQNEVTQPESPAARWASRLVVAGVALTAAWLAALTLGVFAPGLPRLGAYGAVMAGDSFRAMLFALGVTAVAAWLWWRRRTAFRALVVAMAAFALIGTGYVSGRLVATARAESVDLQVAPLFGLGGTDARDPDADVVYLHDQGEDLRIALWQPPAPGPASAARRAPVVALVHGGGWIGGSRLDPLQTARATWLADQGYLVASVGYSLSGPDRHLWDAQEPQLACALTWLGQHARDYGGDPTRLAMVGDSAGGNLVLDVAYRAAAATATSACEGPIPQVKAVSTLYPNVSPAGFYAADRTGSGLAATMTQRHTGGTPAEVPERYEALTPANHLTAAAPPTLMVVPTGDRFVPPADAYALADTLSATGVPNHLVRIYAADHIFDAKSGSAGAQIWRQATLDWFRAHELG